MDYTIRDAPDPELLISNEDLEKLKKNKPETLEVALLQRKLLITKLESTIASKSSLSAELHKVNTLFYGYFDWGAPKDVDGALGLLRNVLYEHSCNDDSSLSIHLIKDIENFLKSIDE